MTAGTVVITGGILATVILLCIIAVLCYCRLQVQGGAGGGATAGCRSREGQGAVLLRAAGTRYPAVVRAGRGPGSLGAGAASGFEEDAKRTALA